MSTKKRAFQRNFTDAALTQSVALPAAPGTVVTPVIDTEQRSNRAAYTQDIEARLTYPGLSATVLPDTRTCTLTIEQSDDPAFGSGVDVLKTKVLTGAGGVGAAAGTVRAGIASDASRYYRGKAVLGASTGNGSAVTITLQLVR